MHVNHGGAKALCECVAFLERTLTNILEDLKIILNNLMNDKSKAVPPDEIPHSDPIWILVAL